MFPTNSERLIGISDAFSAFVYGYPSSCPRAHCTPYKSVPTLRYTRRHGPIYTGHACRHLPSAVPWISEDHLFACFTSNATRVTYKTRNRLDTAQQPCQFQVQSSVKVHFDCRRHQRPSDPFPFEISIFAARRLY